MYATKSVIHRYLEDIPEHGTEVCVPLVLIALVAVSYVCGTLVFSDREEMSLFTSQSV